MARGRPIQRADFEFLRSVNAITVPSADTAAALTVFVIVTLRTYFRDKRPSA